ncbi:DNA-binding protein [Methylomonas sp. MS20]|uniref:DNA-binding protein n=1 Tax=Methylomonas sp. MS20 TaxID=3418769 RepID=UPI003D06AA2B
MSVARYYTAKQLAGLPGMPSTVAGVIYKAGKENWHHRQREGRGGGKEYLLDSLPTETRQHLRKAIVMTETRKTVADVVEAMGLVLPETEARDWQRDRRDARSGVMKVLKDDMERLSCSLDVAYAGLIRAAFDGGPQCPEYRMLTLAKDARGLKGLAEFPNLRSVQRWFVAGDLTPKARTKDLIYPAWADDFLDAYRQPQKPSVEQSYSEFCRHYVSQDRPSIHQVRRFLDKLPAVVREKGRMGSRELKNIKPFVRRTFEELWPNDVWSADGHTFDAEVCHPDHGRPFRPEITTIIDIGTRKVVGFSVGLAESTFATIDALRHAISTHGVQAIWYVDNGSGYANETLENAGIGLLGRFGVTVKHSLPYNSQARGVIERVHKSLWIRMAKQLPSYIGADMDREAKQLNFKLTRTGDKNGVLYLPLSWADFMRRCEDAIAEYNSRPHCSLPKFVDSEGRRRRYSPAEYWAMKTQSIEGFSLVSVDPAEAEMLYKPRVQRTVLRGEISFRTNRYFARTLDVMHGETVNVAYDIHDPQFVWVYDLEGRFVVKAEFNGNAEGYFPKSVIEMARDKRADGRLKRAEAAIEEIVAERDGGNLLEAIPVNELPGMEIIAKKIEIRNEISPGMAATIPEDDRSRHLFWREWQSKAATGTAIPDSLRPFMSSYPNTAKFRSWEAFFNAGNTTPHSASGGAG